MFRPARKSQGRGWHHRRQRHVRHHPRHGQQSAVLASVFGPLKDAMGQAPGGAGTVEAPIAAYPNFEHLEAEGQRLLPEQLKTMLKALAQTNLLRGDAR